MTWRNPETKEFYSKGPLKTKDGTIFNPTEATLKAHGYEVYVAPQIEAVKVEPSEMRRQAYLDGIDEMANKYVNYKADAKKARKDGNEELAEKYDAIAEAIFDEIGEKRFAIREQYPDEVSE